MNVQRLIEQIQVPQAWRARADGLRRQAAAWWEHHPPHERWLLGACAALAVVAIVLLAVLRPAWRTLAEAREQLPLLRSEMVQVQAIVREAQALQQGRSGSVAASQVLAALKGSLARAGLDDTVTAAENGTGRWEITVDGAGAARLMDWLASVPLLVQTQTRSVVLERTVVEGRERPGAVSGRVVLARDEGAAR